MVRHPSTVNLSVDIRTLILVLVPAGQPYNQLAILASSKGDHLTTIFYYCRSIAVKFPFPAAATNLQKALTKALDRYHNQNLQPGHHT